MTHPGLPIYWVQIILGFMIVISVLAVIKKEPNALSLNYIRLTDIPFVKTIVSYISYTQWPLLLLKLITVAVFILVIVAGLQGTQIAERNIATVLTWNIWWAGLIVSVFFLGSAWCAICPWDTIANWFVNPKFLFFKKIKNSLNLTPPKWMRNVWFALFLFIVLSWLELGVGVTTSPYFTALLSLIMIVMATVSLALFKNKAFCHYFCPVGRTIGFYSQLSSIELRPINKDVCSSCTHTSCYSGNENIDPCPTQLVMGDLTQNTYCTSCGNCVKSCHEKNITWRLRFQSNEVIQNARPHWDEAWFMLTLLSLTSFHGITMMDFWEKWVKHLAYVIGDSGQLIISFSIGFVICLLVPVIIYIFVILLIQAKTNVPFKSLFTGLVFVTLPLAFSYHLAHNLNHMIRESVGIGDVLYNPLGYQVTAADMSEIMIKEHAMLLSQDSIFMLQAILMMFGFWVSIKVLQHRYFKLLNHVGWKLMPLILFIIGVHGFNLWLLQQPMIMRFG